MVVELTRRNHLTVVVDDGDIGILTVRVVEALGRAGHGSRDNQPDAGATMSQYNGNLNGDGRRLVEL